MLLTRQPRVWFPRSLLFMLLIFIDGTAQNNGHRLVNQTHLQLDSGELVQQQQQKNTNLSETTITPPGIFSLGPGNSSRTVPPNLTMDFFSSFLFIVTGFDFAAAAASASPMSMSSSSVSVSNALNMSTSAFFSSWRLWVKRKTWPLKMPSPENNFH